MATMQDEDPCASGAEDRNDPSSHGGPAGSGGEFFEIRVRGHLNSNWSDWLEGLNVALLDTGETILSGVITDQAALLGVLNKLNRLNLTLVSVTGVNRKE